MPQPYDYSLGVPSATESFIGGIQMAQQLRQQKLAADAQQAKLDAAARARQYTTDVAAIKDNPSPQALNDLYLKYPEYGDDLKRISGVLNEQDKQTYGTILRRAIIAKQQGKSADEIAGIYAEGAAAAKNANRNDIAQNFDAAVIMAKNPAANDDFAARSLLNQFDPEGYKILYGSEGLTSFQQDIQAAGIDPRSEEGKGLAMQYVRNKADPWIETEVVNPSGQRVMFKGPQSVYMQNYGGGTAPTQNNAPKVGEVRGSYRYAGGDPANQKNWIKVEGGQTGAVAPSGNFR